MDYLQKTFLHPGAKSRTFCIQFSSPKVFSFCDSSESYNALLVV